MNLESLIPVVVEWAEQQERRILAKGEPLSEHGMQLARRIGVENPEKIRVLIVPKMPKIEDPRVQEAASRSSLHAVPPMGGTIGYGILIRRSVRITWRILSHEFRHVYQFEQEGRSLAITVPAHQRAAMLYGFNSPYEIDARMHEVDS